MSKSFLAAVAGAALLFPVALTQPAAAAPVSMLNDAGAAVGQNVVEEARHRRGHRNWRHRHHQHYYDGWPGRHYGWRNYRRCWRECTGIGPLRICKRKCRY